MSCSPATRKKGITVSTTRNSTARLPFSKALKKMTRPPILSLRAIMIDNSYFIANVCIKNHRFLSYHRGAFPSWRVRSRWPSPSRLVMKIRRRICSKFCLSGRAAPNRSPGPNMKPEIGICHLVPLLRMVWCRLIGSLQLIKHPHMDRECDNSLPQRQKNELITSCNASIWSQAKRSWATLGSTAKVKS